MVGGLFLSSIPPSHAAFPGEAGLIAFGRDDQIYTIATDGTRLTPITRSGINKSPAWSPDGSRLAWSCDKDICISNADGSEQEKLLASVNEEQQPEWSPDGEWIVFSRQDPVPDTINYSEPRIFKVEVDDPENVIQLTDFVAADPEWSPDGSEIVFARGDYWGAEGIWAIKPDGSGVRKLLDEYSQNATPDWTPSGRRLMFLGKKWNRWRAIVITRRGEVIREIDQISRGLGIAWSPDGRRIVYVDGYAENLKIGKPSQQGRVLTQGARSPDWQPL
jgi:TolB protein